MKHHPRCVSRTYYDTLPVERIPHPERLGHGGAMTRTPERYIAPLRGSVQPPLTGLRAARPTSITFVRVCVTAVACAVIVGAVFLVLVVTR